MIYIIAVKADKVQIWIAAAQLSLSWDIKAFPDKANVPRKRLVLHQRLLNELLGAIRIPDKGCKILIGLLFKAPQGVLHKNGHSVLNP
nr:hypothetical protein [Paenibacillus rigui]